MSYQGGDLEQRTFNFAVRTVKMVLQLPQHNVAVWVIGKQIINSATSINSNIVHAQAGISRADFINHLRIAKKEAKETKRWAEMLIALGLIKKERMANLLQESEEIIAILVTSVKNAESRDKNNSEFRVQSS